LSPEDKKLPEGIEISSDELGKKISFSIDLNIFDINTVYKAAYWFTEKFYIFFKLESNLVILDARPKDDFRDIKLENIAGEFSNSLLDFHLRTKVSKETNKIRDALITKAFTEGMQSNELDEVKTNEKNLPEEKEKFLNEK
jgi:His-Xaa-Ser system protein HxsD